MNVYKICVIGNHNTIKEIIVFGREDQGQDQIFSEKEREFIKETNPTIRFSQQQIHKDDSIRIIKNKILREFDFAISYEEIYLFSTVNREFSVEDIFEQVSKKRDFIERPIFEQLMI